MGYAILYCSGCSTQLREPDFEKGAAFRADGRVYCKACATDEIRSRAVAPERKSEPPSPATSRIAHVAPPPGNAPSLKPVTMALLIGGGLVIMTLLLAAVSLLGRTPQRPAAPEPDPDPVARPAGPSPVPMHEPSPRPLLPAPPKDERPAQDALRKAREFAQSRPDDLAGQLAYFDAAVVAADGTGHYATAVRERDAVLNRLKPEVKSNLDALDAAAKTATTKDELGKGLKLFEEALARPLGPEWTAEVQRRSQKYAEGVQNAFAVARNNAVAARQRGDEAGVKRVSDRIDKWGIENYRVELSTILAATKVKPPAPPAPSKELAAYRKRWSEAAATAPGRDYAALLKKLEEPKVSDPAAMAEAAADQELLRQAMAVEEEGRQALARATKGLKLTLSFAGESGALVEVSGTVLRVENQGLTLSRDKGPVTVPLGEVAARSLAALAKPRPGGKGAAVLCLLERDVDGAKTFIEGDSGIPEKYWGLVKAPKDPVEADLRKQFWSAERDLGSPARAVDAAQRFAALLKDRSETAFVRRNHPLIAAWAEPCREFYFVSDDLRLRGSFRPARTEKDEPYWKTMSEVDPVKVPENAAEITFSVVPDTDYRCWFYIGGCCTETVSCSFQIAEASDAPGEAAPVKPLPTMLHKTHASHEGRGRPVPRFGWVAIPMGKFTTPGAKKVRLTAAEKGFCVAQALVSATRAGAPSAAETKDLERQRLESRSVNRFDPSLVGHWKLSDASGAVAVDASPAGNDGKLTNGAAWAPGTANPWSPPSIKLEGTAHVNLGGPLPILQGVSACTLAAWICPDKFTQNNNIINLSKFNGTTPTIESRADLTLTTGGNLSARARCIDSTAAQSVVAVQKIKAGAWVHVAAVIDFPAHSITLYVNGAPQATRGTVKFSEKATPNTPSTCGAIGADDDGSTAFFLGRIADVRIYSRALTREEVAELAVPR
jgi:hypothetical protein